ncbi:MAG: MFS transporter [Caldilineaceae bacterium]
MKESIWRNPLLLTVYVPTLVISAGRRMLVSVLPFYADNFHASYGSVGLLLASESIGMIIGDVPAGILISKLGLRRAMIVGVGLVAAMVLAMSFARSLPELILYGLISGIGTALWNISRHAYLSNTVPVHQRGRAIAIFGGVNRMGSFAGPAMGGLIGVTLGLRSVFWVYAALAAIAMLFPALFAGEADSASVNRRGGLRGHSHHFWELLRTQSRIFLTAGSGQLMAQMIRAGRDFVLPLYGKDILGLDVQETSLILSMGSGIDMLLFLPAGMIMDRFGRKFAYVPSFTLQAIGMALIPFTWNFATLVTAAMFIGFGNGLGSGTMMTLGADLAPRDSMGEFLGLWRLIGDGGSSSGPIVIGSVAQLLGLIPAIFVIAGVGASAAAILGLLVPETLKTKRLDAQPQG